MHFIYQAAKDVVLAEKPVISDDSNQYDSSLLDELLANVSTLSSVYHKPPETFVTRVRTLQKTEEEEFPEGSDGGGYTETSSAHIADNGASPPNVTAKQPPPAPAAAVLDLLDLIGLDGDSGGDNSIVSADQPVQPTG